MFKFIERVTNENIKNFADKLECVILVIDRRNMGKEDANIYVEMSAGYYGSHPICVFTDFDCKMNADYKKLENDMRKAWKRELYSIFGEDYKIALKKKAQEVAKQIEEELYK